MHGYIFAGSHLHKEPRIKRNVPNDNDAYSDLQTKNTKWRCGVFFLARFGSAVVASYLSIYLYSVCCWMSSGSDMTGSAARKAGWGGVSEYMGTGLTIWRYVGRRPTHGHPSPLWTRCRSQTPALSV